MKAGRVRCGGCDRILLHRRNRRQGHHYKLEAMLAERDPAEPWTQEQIEALLTLSARPIGENPVKNQKVTRGGVDYFLATCPCGRHFAAPDFDRRRSEAVERGEDLILTDADHYRRDFGVSQEDK